MKNVAKSIWSRKTDSDILCGKGVAKLTIEEPIKFLLCDIFDSQSRQAEGVKCWRSYGLNPRDSILKSE